MLLEQKEWKIIAVTTEAKTETHFFGLYYVIYKCDERVIAIVHSQYENYEISVGKRWSLMLHTSIIKS